jgi:hypothetical protein
VALFLIGVITGCPDEIPEGREQVIDGRFSHWPVDGEQGDAWRAGGDAVLSVAGDDPSLEIEAPGSSHAGAETLVPVIPGETYELSFRHRGGSGRWLRTVDDDGATTVELPASPSWRKVEHTLTPTRDGVRLQFQDAPHDGDTLELDDVHLAAPTEGPRTEEPPIRVVFVVHAEPDVGDAERYWERRNELAALADLAEGYGLPLTVLLAGPQAEWAVDQDDTAFYVELQQRGHEVGTHTHPVSFIEHNHWEVDDIFADGVAHQQWGDHRAWVDQVVDPATNTTMCGYAPMALLPSLMADHGFSLDLASVAVTSPNGSSREAVAWEYLGHHPHHPYRPADTSVPGEELAGDPAAGYVTVSHAAQVGRALAHGGPALAVDYIRVFDQTVDRWTGHQRTPALAGDDQVWVFGFLHHLGEWDEHGDELENLLQHLHDTALGRSSEEGNVIATGATAREVLLEFERWEQDHPGEAQFSFTVPP